MRLHHGAYYFVRKDVWTLLAHEYGPALIKYSGMVTRQPEVVTFAQAMAHYLESSAKRLAAATLEGYRRSSANLAPIFGDMALPDITPAQVYRYLVERGNVQANRDRALISVTYTHARRIGAFMGDNPAKGLQFRNEEKPRQRYVTDGEQAVLLSAASPKLACIVRFLHLTAMRQGDALRLKLSDLDDEGFTYWNTKGKKWQGLEWSPELSEVVAEANRLWRRFGRAYLFESHPKGRYAKRGPGPYTPSGLRALWRVARARTGVEDVTLHDLRRKAGSDVSEAHAQALLGHSSVQVTRRHYRAKTERVKPAR